MIKKLLLTLAPVLALAVFAVMPAFAQAETKAYGTCEATTKALQEHPPCPENERHFKAFANKKAEKVISKLDPGETFVLTTAAGVSIECTSFSDKGTVTNEAGVGHSEEELVFDHCTFTNGPLAGCSVKSTGAPNSNEIIGKVTNVVLTEVTVEIKVTAPGIKLETDGNPAGCPVGAQLGTVTGTAVGKQEKGSDILIFTKATGLKLGEEAATITGSDILETAAGKPIVIN